MSGSPPEINQLLGNGPPVNRLLDIELLSRRRQGVGCQLAPILLTLGEAWLPPPSGLLDALASQPAVAHGYQFSEWGHPELLATLRKNVPIEERWPADARLELAVSWHGTRAVLHDLAAAILRDHDDARGRPGVLVTAPGYDYATPFIDRGFQVVPLPLDPESGFALDEARVIDAIDLAAARGIVPAAVMLNPQHSPSGRNWTEAEVFALASAAQTYKAHLIIDNAYFDVVQAAPDCTSAVQVVLRAGYSTKRLIVTRSLGKAHLCNGWGLGWFAGDPDLVRKIVEQDRWARSYGTHGFLQSSMAAWLESGAAVHRFREQRRLDHERRLNIVTPKLKQIAEQSKARFVVGRYTPFALLQLPHRSPGEIDSVVTDIFRATSVLATGIDTVAPVNECDRLAWLRFFTGLPDLALAEAFNRLTDYFANDTRPL